jgi:hypothetical protein
MRVKVPGGFHLRNSAGEREWLTASGKANFYAHPVPTDQSGKLSEQFAGI